MDDRNFDENSALDWIQLIEDPFSLEVRNQDLYPFLKNWILKTSAKNILDLGCGQGICSDHLGLTAQQNYTGLDASLQLIARAEQLYSNSQRQFVVGSLYQLPFQDKSFEAAFSVATWHLLEDLSSAAKELARVLKGNFLIVTADPAQYEFWTQNYYNPKQIGVRFEGFYKSKVGDQLKDVLYLHDQKQILSSLEEHGLQIDRTEVHRRSLYILGSKL